MIFGPDYAWALSTSALDPHTAETLMVMARELFPHDRLGDEYYAAVVDAVDKQAAGNAELRKLLTDGVAQLDAARGLPVATAQRGRPHCRGPKTVKTGPFFAAMRTATINNLYTNQLVYRYFGFEGSSAEYGGYINRGFDESAGYPIRDREERPMAKTFDLTDELVIVVIGSGAGGGTLSNELALRGIDVDLPRGRTAARAQRHRQRQWRDVQPPELA